MGNGQLFKVWGSGPDDVWVVGNETFFLHWDGSEWSKVDTPALSGPFFTITGRGPNDVWAIGGFLMPELLHWDGSEWASVPMPEFAPGNMPGLWTAPGQSVYVAGMGGYTARLDPGEVTFDESTLYAYTAEDGGAWHEGLPATGHMLHGIGGDGQGGLYAVGGNIATLLDDHTGVLLSTRSDLGDLP